jgi:hypothetical protein
LRRDSSARPNVSSAIISSSLSLSLSASPPPPSPPLRSQASMRWKIELLCTASETHTNPPLAAHLLAVLGLLHDRLPEPAGKLGQRALVAALRGLGRERAHKVDALPVQRIPSSKPPSEHDRGPHQRPSFWMASSDTPKSASTLDAFCSVS